MANFPTSVYAPAAKAAGQTIQAAHVNSLDDEVAAIEDGYLNATARLNSSNSTLANLSVTGGSTLANLSVTGGSTFGGPVTFSSAVSSLSVSSNVTIGGLLALASQPRCWVTAESSQTISTAAEVAVTFNTNKADVGGFHSTATNPTQFKFPSTGFFYGIGHVSFDAAGATTDRQYAYWKLNNASALGGIVDGFAMGSAGYHSGDPWFCYACNSTSDYVEMIVFSKVATKLNDGASTGFTMARAFVHRVG